MSFAVVMTTDRPHYREEAEASLKEHCPVPTHHIVVDDTEHKLGFTGAVREGFRRVRELNVEWVFWAEDDFIYSEPIPIQRMTGVLTRRPYLVSLSLLRQPVNRDEKRAGGIIPQWPDEFHQVHDGGDCWVETRRWAFTTNPSLFPAALCHQKWPDVEHSEGIFSQRLLADPNVRHGIWGLKDDEPRCHHIGAERAGHGY